MFQSGNWEVTKNRESGEGGWVELLKLIALKLEETKRREALECIGVDELKSVVIQVQPSETPETHKGLSANYHQFIIA